MTEHEAKAIIEDLTDEEKVILLCWLLARKQTHGPSDIPME